MSLPQDPIPREALARAAEVVGGREPLARRLGVKTVDLERWIKGEGTPPSPVIFAALNLIEHSKP
jgi:DNA-binding transcriptional regulator YdaS (Cro superfamily)